MLLTLKRYNTKNLQRKKSQIALEFFIYIGVVIFLFVIIGIASLAHWRDVQTEQRIQSFQDFAYSIQYQLVVLVSLKTGMQITMDFPEKIANQYEYTLSNNNLYLILQYEDEEYILPIPQTSGNFTKGSNTIVNNEGVLIVS